MEEAIFQQRHKHTLVNFQASFFFKYSLGSPLFYFLVKGEKPIITIFMVTANLTSNIYYMLQILIHPIIIPSCHSDALLELMLDLIFPCIA